MSIPNISKRLEREEEMLQEALNSGNITVHEYNEEMRSTQRSAREEAREEAEKAYWEVLENY